MTNENGLREKVQEVHGTMQPLLDGVLRPLEEWGRDYAPALDSFTLENVKEYGGKLSALDTYSEEGLQLLYDDVKESLEEDGLTFTKSFKEFKENKLLNPRIQGRLSVAEDARGWFSQYVEPLEQLDVQGRKALEAYWGLVEANKALKLQEHEPLVAQIAGNYHHNIGNLLGGFLSGRVKGAVEDPLDVSLPVKVLANSCSAPEGVIWGSDRAVQSVSQVGGLHRHIADERAWDFDRYADAPFLGNEDKPLRYLRAFFDSLGRVGVEDFSG
jgi:hypothetical protein